MKLSIQRENLLKPLQAVIGVVEKRHTMAILANVLIKTEKTKLTIIATDLEIEMIATSKIDKPGNDGIVSVPARKLFDIVRSLPEESEIKLIQQDNRMVINSGRSRFVLSTLNAADFPSIESDFSQAPIKVPQNQLLHILKRTYFAMAQQDVRYFLNGLLLEIKEDTLRVVATDGHRLAMASEKLADKAASAQVIIPRKAVLELMRLLQESEKEVELYVGTHHVRIILPEVTFTSKLLDGRYPDYKRVIPAPGSNVMSADKSKFRQALSRTAILSNEKYRGVRLNFDNKLLKLAANNPEQEEAEDEIEVSYKGDKIEIGFNVSYLLDVLNAIDGDNIQVSLANANSSALIHDGTNHESVYVVMPIRL